VPAPQYKNASHHPEQSQPSPKPPRLSLKQPSSHPRRHSANKART
jgi:hypothetical protein